MPLKQIQINHRRAALVALGIDPSEVLVDGADETGYLMIDAHHDLVTTTRMPWPSADAFERFKQAGFQDAYDTYTSDPRGDACAVRRAADWLETRPESGTRRAVNYRRAAAELRGYAQSLDGGAE